MNARENSKTRRLCVAGLAFLGVTTAGLTGITQEKIQKSTAGQKRPKIVGMRMNDNLHWRALPQPKGTVVRTATRRTATDESRVESDQLCIEFEKEPVPKCYDVWLSGKQVELRREGLLPLQGALEPPTGRN